MTTAQIQLSPKLLPLFAPPRGDLKYRGAYGGRGGGKSHPFALMAAVWGMVEPLRILCTRELQNSVKESFHAEIKNAILSTPWLADAYDVGESYVKGKNGTEFIFSGLRHNISSIKSMAKIDLCIVEEAEDVPENSWIDLLPTIRAPKSEVWVIWNRKKENSPVDKRFIKNTPSRSMIVNVNYTDNPWFPPELEELRLDDKRIMDPGQYRNIWLGDYYNRTEANVFMEYTETSGAGWEIVEETPPRPDSISIRRGMDFGFAADPTVVVNFWIDEENKVLCIVEEVFEYKLEIDKYPDLIDNLQDPKKWKIIADSSRPESISYLKQRGYKVESSKKGKGSIEHGIDFLRGYHIIIDSRCVNTIEEFEMYSYKVDKSTGEVLPDIIDKFNHCIDAIRYGAEPVSMKSTKKVFV